MSDASPCDEFSEGNGNPPVSPIEWRAVVAGVKSDDPTVSQAAAEQIYKLFNRGIRSYLCRQLGPQDIEDRAQDTFLVVLNAIKRGDLREPERLMGYVRTITRRQVAGEIDKRVHERRERTELDAGVQVADRRDNPEHAVMQAQKRAVMAEALAALRPDKREILERFYLEEQPPERIQREMGLTETQFRLLKSRAKADFGEAGKNKLQPNMLKLLTETLREPAAAAGAGR